MNLEQLQLGQDLAKEIKEVTNQLNAWKNAVNIQRSLSLDIKGSNYYFEADKRYIDFNVMRSLAICKLEEKLKTLHEQFKPIIMENIIILVGLQGTGKSRLVRLFESNKNVQFIEIQEESGDHRSYTQFGKILIIDLNNVGFDRAADIISNFIIIKNDNQYVYKVGDIANFRSSYEKFATDHVCIEDCKGYPKDNEKCFKKL